MDALRYDAKFGEKKSNQNLAKNLLEELDYEFIISTKYDAESLNSTIKIVTPKIFSTS
jgi:hypothetical protein